MAGKIQCFGLSDIGKVRETNEDQFIVADVNKSMKVHQTSVGLNHHTRLFGGSQGTLLAVADGMGGHAAGERASEIVVETVTAFLLNTMQWYFQVDDVHDEETIEQLRQVTSQCHEKLSQDIATSPQRRGMGATLTLGYVLWPRLFVVHVGDSRCYHFRQGKLEQITNDHTMAQYLIETGALSPEDAVDSQWSHQLYNVIGGGDQLPEPDISRHPLEMGDALLLCSDGLTKYITDARIGEALASDAPADEVCRVLCNEALLAGGDDNITIVVCRFLPGDDDENFADLDTTDMPIDQRSTQLLSPNELLQERPTDPE
ncbi:Serine/threonine phosphatase stp [Lignipirellula cremea]|uniref:Serine/threonine phosphatase stp n=2 Tax=Lignipirellula cremea TaxID=2528010 RepID=A0A518E111_9BACT|nr:Serine/threonine phosphatase stp [Lignipirellula cremea]